MNMNWLWNPCRSTQARIRLRAAGLLSGPASARLDQHLDRCPACRRYAAELDALAQSLRAAPLAQPERELSPQARARWRNAVRAEAATRRPAASLLESCGLWVRLHARAVGSLATVWGLIAFFQLSAPDAPVASMARTPALSDAQVMAVLLESWKEFKTARTKAPVTADSAPARMPAVPAPQGRQLHHPSRFA